MVYIVVMEEKANAQAKILIYLEASLDGQIVPTNTTDYEVCVVAMSTTKELTDIWVMMKQLAALVTAQAATGPTLFTKMNGDGFSTRRTTNKKNVWPSLHVCVHCKQDVYHKDWNCL